MPCEHCKDALVEAAATGVEPQGELRAHLAACASCRAAFTGEQSLFASIDVGLHATANAEVPLSLLPRVRAALEEVSVPRRTWLSNGFALATAAAMVVALSVSLAVRHRGSGGNVGPTVANTNPPTPLPPAPQVQAPNPALQTRSNFTFRPGGITASKHPERRGPAGGANLPEVLVPSDQSVLLARYAEEWSRHKRAPLVAENSSATTLVPMEVAPIQIDQLDVKLLAEEKSQ
jgi:hypothetical protein